MMKIRYILILTFILLMSSGCGGSASDGIKTSKDPGYEYMPDMYHSHAYETYSVNPNFSDSMSARLPVEGTIPRGFYPFDYKVDEPGDVTYANFNKAGSEMENDRLLLMDDFQKENYHKEGKQLYGMFCAHCHGKNGDGGQADGTIVEYFTNAPSFIDSVAPRIRSGKPMIEFEPGHIYHTIFYGYESMGPHASLITDDERWKIIYYISELQNKAKN